MNKTPPEAFDYDSDVTSEAVKFLQEKADAAMKDGKWVHVKPELSRKKP